MDKKLGDLLDARVKQYNQPRFIQDDPISVPHAFTKSQDIEIAGFFAATFAWGNRTTIILKGRQLMQLMDNAPYDFCRNHQENDLHRFLEFRHRTFNATDLLYFISFLKSHYQEYNSLEQAFTPGINQEDKTTEGGLRYFFTYFFSGEFVPARTMKHIASPEKHSACKRLNMFLRWMVRSDQHGVDFGLWKHISPAQLVCPLDVHSARVARHIGLLKRKQTDWAAAVELTAKLKEFDPTDPVKYDFALFNMGIIEKF